MDTENVEHRRNSVIESNNVSLNEAINKKISFEVVAVNVNSLVSHEKRYTLLQFIEKQKPDIILISETKLKKRHKTQFADYAIYRTDRPNADGGGGTAVMVKNTYPLECVNVLTHLSARNEVLEYTVAIFSLSMGQKLYVISAYANNLARAVYAEELDSLFSKLKLNELNNFFILAGDLNSRIQEWGDRFSYYKGNLLRDWEAERSHLYNPASSFA